MEPLAYAKAVALVLVRHYTAHQTNKIPLTELVADLQDYYEHGIAVEMAAILIAHKFSLPKKEFWEK
jgi:hypothetical protein